MSAAEQLPNYDQIAAQVKKDNIALMEPYLQIMKETGYSQGKLAKAIGVKQGTVSKWFSGEHTPRKEHLYAMKDHLQNLIIQKSGESKNRPISNYDQNQDFDFNPLPSIQKSLADLVRYKRAESFKTDPGENKDDSLSQWLRDHADLISEPSENDHWIHDPSLFWPSD